MQVTLTKVHRTDKNKNGDPLINRNGQPYTRTSIKTQEHNDRWLNGFGNQENAQWQIGQQVEIIIEENGQYLNFKMPRSESSISRVEFDDLKAHVKSLEDAIREMKQSNDSKPSFHDSLGMPQDLPPF